MLTLHPFAHIGSGGQLSDRNHVYQYEVNGLPAGEQAFISENHHRWQFLRITHGAQGKWTGEYASPEEALKALEQIVAEPC